MNETALFEQTAKQAGVDASQVSAVDALLADGATVPFIARYRKERTGELDESQIRTVRDTLAAIRTREHRREFVRAQIREQGELTGDRDAALAAASSLAEIEDIYLPFKKSRATRATRARTAGLEPLAKEIYAQNGRSWNSRVDSFICESYPDHDSVLLGCRDVIAAWIAEDAPTRSDLRELFARRSVFQTTKRKENQRFADFYSFTRPVTRLSGHRLLGALRAVEAGAVRLTARPEDSQAHALIERHHLRGEPQVKAAAEDAYRRLLLPSLEKELIAALKEKADQEAISVFAENLRQILLQPPLGERAVLAVDPGFRTGCKLAALDRQGTFLAHDVIYPVEPHLKTEEAAQTVRGLISKFDIDVIAVGNGTAGRETERFLRSLALDGVLIVLTDESGASVYSASELARGEFPELDLTVRGAISIGRRLQDPLAELVKIDPRSIGVGQYQHDVDERALTQALEEIVEECVNRVGVHLNQASAALLRFVAGLSSRTAEAVVAARTEQPFTRREQLLNVPGIGPRAYEQAAGFLRIRGGGEPLDATAVHPEHYPIATAMLAAAGLSPQTPLENRQTLRDLRLDSFVTGEVGLPTLADIRDELLRPGRDPRDTFEPPSFREDVNSIDDLKEGMILTGIVTNLTRFGAFVDLGVHQDGLVHVSEIAQKFVSDPATELRIKEQVRVKVISVDTERARIGLSIRQAGADE